MRKFFCFCFFAALFSAFGQEPETDEKNGAHIIPILRYNLLTFAGRSVHSPGGGLAVTIGDMEPERIEERSNLLIAALYRSHIFEEPLRHGYPGIFHDINFLLHGKEGRHHYQILFESYSDKPVSGGLRTFTLGGGYAYEIIHSHGHSLILGGGLGIFYTGIKLDDGSDWPLLPVPLLHYEYRGEWVAVTFDFKTQPQFDLTLGARKPLRLNLSAALSRLVPKRFRDLNYDISLEYRLFDENFQLGDAKLGDFAGVRIGFAFNDYPGMIPGGSETDSLKLSWFTVYGGLDLQFLLFSIGYAFEGEELYGSRDSYDLKDGLFLSALLRYRF